MGQRQNRTVRKTEGHMGTFYFLGFTSSTIPWKDAPKLTKAKTIVTNKFQTSWYFVIKFNDSSEKIQWITFSEKIY